MAKVFELSEEFASWASSRPQVVQDLIASHPPDRLYRIKSSGHRCTICSYNEHGTITVNITGDYNCVLFDREVFGIDPKSLEECDLPAEHELLGTFLEI